MVIETVKELEAAKAKVAELEGSLVKELNAKLAKLPSEFGFDSLASFIKALKAAASGKKSRIAKSGKAPKKKRSKRAKITAATKEQVKALVDAGKTGSAIAKELRISLPSVQNIKKELGLVKSR